MGLETVDGEQDRGLPNTEIFRNGEKLWRTHQVYTHRTICMHNYKRSRFKDVIISTL